MKQSTSRSSENDAANLERLIYSSGLAYWANQILFPIKVVIPQPVIAKIPGLTTNEDIRIGMVGREIAGRVVDIGCGFNRLVRNYREAGGDGVGIDVYPWDGVDLVVEDTSRLPFEEGSFDTVTLVACLNHIPNRESVLKEAHRILKPDGRLVFTNLPPLLSLVWHKWAFWDPDRHERGMKQGEVWGFCREELEAMVIRAGFCVVRRVRFSWGINQLYVCERATRARYSA
ncbi:MAG: class I SAM-dependent methyltransferase [Terriglobia bacterium]